MAALNINEVILGGRVVNEIVLHKTKSDISACNILIAVNGSKDTKPEFIEVSFYGDLAESISKKCNPKDTIMVWGKLKYYKDINKLKVRAIKAQLVVIGEKN